MNSRFLPEFEGISSEIRDGRFGLVGVTIPSFLGYSTAFAILG